MDYPFISTLLDYDFEEVYRDKILVQFCTKNDGLFYNVGQTL